MGIIVVGGGKMGMSHLALITQYLGKRNVVLCDTKLSRRMMFRLLGYKTFSDLDTATSAVDSPKGVLIATPTPSHASLVKWAINRGLPCFVEKPLTLDVAASSELMTLAAAKGVPVQVGFVFRYLASFQRLWFLVRHHSFGAVLGYKASMRGNVILKQPSPESWQGHFKKGGGCLNEYGPHIIDLCQFIFGLIDEVNEARMSQVFCSDADDQIDFICSHRNGSKGSVEIDWCDNSKRKSIIEFNVKFEHAEVRVDNSAVEITCNEHSRMSEDRRQELSLPIIPKNVAYYLRGEEFSLELEDFLQKCVGYQLNVDDSVSPGTTPGLKDGFEVDRLIDIIARKVSLK